MTRRLPELDALRGFAVCGITLVNTWQHTREHLDAPGRNGVDWAIENLLQGRFYPIFSFLFGVGFVLFLRSAAERTDRPRLVLLRRLAVLACFGALHRIVNPGEVLLPYAAFGALVLLPASFLPRAATAPLGITATAWAVGQGGGMLLIPGLFLLGMAAMEYAPARWPPPASWIGTAFLIGTTAAAGLGYLWIRAAVGNPLLYFRGVYPAAGLAAATAYCAGLLLLLRTPLRGALLAALSPLGRMALTNYLAGTAIIVTALPVLTADPTRMSGVALAVAALAAQIAAGRMWLKRFRHGPLEWLWRRLTWLEPVPGSRIRSNT